MISTNGISLSYGERVLFQDVNIKFLTGNCYGLIGANGAGKSTFLKILSGTLAPDRGDVAVVSGMRVAGLKQNQFEFDEYEVLETVLQGHQELFRVLKEKSALYAKEDFSESDGIQAAELEEKFAALNGWEAESQAGEMLETLGVPVALHQTKMKELEAGLKVRVLLAQALAGNPDILLLDEPTNNLDLKTIMWLEEFLLNFKNTVIVVSHDRHFLDKVSTHMADIDFNKVELYTGNYSFWYESSQLALKQRGDRNRKSEEKVKELKTFIERFSANASKSRQATSRRKLLGKISFEEIKPSTRRYPHIVFQQEREAGKDMLSVENLSATLSGKTLFNKATFNITKGEKVAFVGKDSIPAATLFRILAGEDQPAGGEFRWGVTTTVGYFPKDHERYFQNDLSLLDWLRQFARKDSEREEEFLRAFLGKMLFSGQEVKKTTSVLSGGEKVRCMLSKLMMMQANVLVLDEPTNHLDLESITALNNGIAEFPGTVLILSQDRQTIDTVAQRIIELTPRGIIDRHMIYSEFLEDESIAEERERMR
jgi:ATPase subunit of ABC transporter with duplicated ATPase domains